ncbi:MAG TPA: hypothetical protein VFP56_07725, partial [Candidatus Limnocylindrales bacterium]|nr:hypothetical protein [Candidatus Limnocylindrales bacterium]
MADERPEPAPAVEPAPLSLLYLDVDDEITSAAARIRAAGAEDVALVLPYGSRLATSRINFRLLAREAAARGKKIEIIGADASARALAIAAGLPTHASVAAFEAYRRGETPSDGTADGTGAAGAAVAAAVDGQAGRVSRVRNRVGALAGGASKSRDARAPDDAVTDATAIAATTAAGAGARKP